MGLRVGALTRSWARRALWAGLRGGKREWAARLGLGRSVGAGWTRERLGRAGLDAVESWAGVGREVGCGLG